MKLHVSATIIFTVLVTTLLLCNTSSQAQIVHLQIGAKKLVAELASTQNAMITGLSKTEHLSQNSGMLFIFPFTDFHCMTMKSTKIPLSLVFLDSDFKIIETTNMQPLSNVNYCASKPASYAIEAAYNWFNGISDNTKVVILK